MKCGKKCEVFSRVVGYMRPVSTWNIGKKSEWKERVEYDLDISLKSKFATRMPIEANTVGQTILRE